MGLFLYPQTYKSGGNRIAFEGLINLNKNNMIQSKKYKITLDYKVYESDNLHELEKLAVNYSIQEEGFPLYLNKYNYSFYPIDFMQNIYEPENIVWLIYNNHLHIHVNVDLVTKKELKEFRKIAYNQFL